MPSQGKRIRPAKDERLTLTPVPVLQASSQSRTVSDTDSAVMEAFHYTFVSDCLPPVQGITATSRSEAVATRE